MSETALRVVTWNIWFGEWQRELRWRALWQELDRVRPDVVCLQEITPELVTGRELDALQGRGVWLSDAEIVDYDVIITSRLRVRDSERVPLPSVMGRNLLVVRLATDPPLTVATVHLESTAAMTGFRLRQLDEITSWLAREPNVLLVGDMNFPDGERPELAALAGWQDAWLTLRPGEPGYTVDSDANEMRALTKPAVKQARLDRAFLRGDGWQLARIERLGLKPLDDDPLTFISDHFGLQIDLCPVRP